MLKKEMRLLAFDRIKRKFLKNYWFKKKISNFILKNYTLLTITKQIASLKMSDVIFKKGACSHVRNRCLFTGRAHAVDSTYRVSRFSLRVLANGGYINSLGRASW